MFENFEFLNPSFLWLLLILPLLIVWNYFRSTDTQAKLSVSSTKGFDSSSSFVVKLRPLLFVLRLLAIASLIIALARPRTVDVTTKTKTNKGIDIVMAIDVSGSMLAKDFQPNRLEALKKVAIEFVEGRPNDRIGIVVYAGESYTQNPLTSDKSVVINSINKLTWGQIEDGTAIGMGLGSSINRLKDSKASSKVIILLTDGVNNTGFVDRKSVV